MAFRVIISPAKKMNVVEGPPNATARPALLDRALLLAHALGEMDLASSRKLWNCSDALARLNFHRTRTLEQDMQAAPEKLTPAILAFEGIQYLHLAPQVMTEDELDWLVESLRVLSGLYGVLRPLDGVVPYRLEMQARLAVDGARNLYEFWDKRLFEQVASDDGGCDAIVNLASVEYARALVPHAERAGMRVVTCLFGTIRERDGKLIQRATEAKAARGTMVRWCAERDVHDTDELRLFRERGYALNEARSSGDLLVFVQDARSERQRSN
jgi:cytoplasmic iron level regulating protein YaaA (DUF328/UPF0246 family)